VSSNDAFNEGIFHQQAEGRFNQMSPGLAGASDSWTSQVVSAATRPSSVLDTLAFSSNQSPNGSAGQNWQPGLGTLGTGNGMSDETRQQNLDLRFLGGDQDAGLG
jgi:hypothetical protein